MECLSDSLNIGVGSGDLGSHEETLNDDALSASGATLMDHSPLFRWLGRSPNRRLSQVPGSSIRW